MQDNSIPETFECRTFTSLDFRRSGTNPHPNAIGLTQPMHFNFFLFRGPQLLNNPSFPRPC